ncbi:MAG: LysR family transcriptional regulator [Burkholderiales bacterium]|nr:LysR family transcriptional regulator [Burkholderiales bacterium]
MKPRPGLESLDFRLLSLFDTVYEHRSFTLAAQRLAMTQPAVSQAMARMRRWVGDPLFVRAVGGLMPTARADSLIVPVREVLDTFRARIARSAGFDAATSEREFVIAASDLGPLNFLPQLLKRFSAVAPHLRVRMLSLESGGVAVGLESAQADLAIGAFPRMPGGIFRQRLFEDTYLCLMRRDHPLARRKLSVADYIAAEHALVVTGGTGHAFNSLVEQNIAARVPAARIRVRLPHFTAAAFVVADSDLLLTLPARAAKRFARDLGLIAKAPPLAFKRLEIAQYWHERSRHDAGHAWLRAEVVRLSGSA